MTRPFSRRPWLLTLLGLAVSFLFLFPIYWMLISSLKSAGEIYSTPPTFFPREVYVQNYIAVFSKGSNLLLYVRNSLIRSVFTMLGSLALACPAAYIMTRRRDRVISALLLFIILVQMIPGSSVALPLYIFFSRVGLTNSMIGLVLSGITAVLPFTVLVLRTSYLSVPPGLDEAARVDGCGRWGGFLRIILPLIKPGLMTCGAFSFIMTWGEFLYALVLLSDDRLWPITMGMQTFMGQYTTDWGKLMAVATVSSVPILLIFIFTQKHIVAGITAGAIKE